MGGTFKMSYIEPRQFGSVFFPSKSFMENIRSGEKVLFWHDRWLGEWPLARQFPDIFNCDLNKEARVHCYLSSYGEHKVWSPILRRNLKDMRKTNLFL